MFKPGGEFALHEQRMLFIPDDRTLFAYTVFSWLVRRFVSTSFNMEFVARESPARD